ncbi:MAG: YfhO family protein [Paludibacter sp.]|nr:YfhO family protein [Paludibacter sp.]
MNKKIFTLLVPHIVAVAVFLILAYVYCLPMIEGKVLQGHDTTNWGGMAHETMEYNASHSDKTLWTNSMFGGMPTYQIAEDQPNNLLQYVEKFIDTIAPRPAFFIFLYLICFYILALCFGINPYLAIVAAVAFSFSSYNEIIIAAGHNSKAITIAYIAPLIGSIFLAFRKNRIAGGVLTAIFLSLAIRANHIQILYYALIILIFFAIVEFIFSIIDKKIISFFKTAGVIAVAAIIALGMNAAPLLTTYEYSQYTMRGKSNGLTIDTQSSQHGLNSTYINQWSYGIGESLTTFIPDFRGGASAGKLGENSQTAKHLENLNVPTENIKQYISHLPLYWGEQPGTSGPVYFGAIVVFLFVLGLMLVDKREKWWLVPMILLTLFLSWGGNFTFLTDFFINHFPMYNKFRAPSTILVATGFGVGLMAVLALKKIFETKDKSTLLKPVIIAASVVGAICLIFAVIPSLAGNFVSPQDKQFSGDWSFLQETLPADRATMLSASAWRSLLFVLLAAVVIFLYSKNLIKNQIALIFIGLFILIDMIPVDKRYLGSEQFTTRRLLNQQIEPTAADRWIMDNDKSYYRVLDATKDIFNSAIPAYFHKNIGGYHAAKLRRYQELINMQLTGEIGRLFSAFGRATSPQQIAQTVDSLQVLNMLNMKYVIYNPEAQPLINYAANGNAWFVDSIVNVNNANDEMLALGKINTKTEAVIDVSQIDKLKETLQTQRRDTAATIQLTEYQPNKLTYQVSTKSEQFAVFSEIYYDKGWTATIDGKQMPYERVNYLLRGMELPAGNYQLQFAFNPASYSTGNVIALISSILLIICIVGYFVFIFLKNKKEE